MRISTRFFQVVTCWGALIFGNILILGMVLFVIYASSASLSSCLVADLRSETISTIIIAWGVLLESREALRRTAGMTRAPAEMLEAVVSSEAERSGLLLVCLGLLLEIITYFDASAHMASLSSLTSILHGIIWFVLLFVCLELSLSSFNLTRVRFNGSISAHKEL
jgi:hypothetical protein